MREIIKAVWLSIVARMRKPVPMPFGRWRGSIFMVLSREGVSKVVFVGDGAPKGRFGNARSYVEITGNGRVRGQR